MLEAGHRLDQPATCTVDLYTLLLECELYCVIVKHLVEFGDIFLYNS